MGLRQLECENCGAPIEWDGTYGEAVHCPFCGSTFVPAATEMQDVWLMTDPVARARYEFNGTLDKLEHDIRFMWAYYRLFDLDVLSDLRAGHRAVEEWASRAQDWTPVG